MVWVYMGDWHKKRIPTIAGILEITGAVSRIRTGDPILTMDVLYLLS